MFELYSPYRVQNIDVQVLDLLAKPGIQSGRIRGTISFKLGQRRGPQKYGVKAAAEQDFSMDKGKMKIEPQKLAIIPDPEEERKRQISERLNLPGIIKKVREESPLPL